MAGFVDRVARHITYRYRRHRPSVPSWWLSRHCNNQSVLTRPIVGPLRARIARHQTARIIVDGQLDLRPLRTAVGRISPDRPVSIEMLDASEMTIEGYARLGGGVRLRLGSGGKLRIGDGTSFDGDALVIAADSVAIGANCTIAWDVLTMDSDFHTIDANPQMAAPVTIGDRVWIAAGVKILKGVTVGDGAIIAAGAIVISDVPPAALVAGVPARVVRSHVTWR